METQLLAIDQVRTLAIDTALRFGPKLLVAALVLYAGHLAGGWIARATARGIARFGLEPPVRSLLERAVRVVVMALFVILALQNLGVELLPLVAGLSVAGAGVALAMQGVLSNMVAGLTIIFTQPFRVGDYISIAKEEGIALDINLFSTTLGHSDRSRVVIPNRKIVGEILHNFGRIRQLSLGLDVGYNADLAAVIRAVQEALAANPRLLRDPEPVVVVSRLADAVRIGVHPWASTAEYGAAVNEVNQALVDMLRRHHIVVPMPQREVHLVGKAA